MMNTYINGQKTASFPRFRFKDEHGNFLLSLLGVNLDIRNLADIAVEPVYMTRVSLSSSGRNAMIVFRRQNGFTVVALQPRRPFFKIYDTGDQDELYGEELR